MKNSRIALAAFVFAFVAISASAQEAPTSLRLPSAIYLLSASADLASTAHCFGVSIRCQEANPAGNWIRGGTSSATMIAAGAAFDVATVYAVNRLLGQTHPKLATSILVAGAALRTSLAMSNLRLASSLGRCNVSVPMACKP